MNQGDAKQAGTAQKTLGRAIRGRFLAKPGDLEQIRNDHRAAEQHQHEGFRRHPVELAIRIGILSQIGMVLQMIPLLNFKIGDKQRAQDPPTQNVIDALAGAQVPMPSLVVQSGHAGEPQYQRDGPCQQLEQNSDWIHG